MEKENPPTKNPGRCRLIMMGTEGEGFDITRIEKRYENEYSASNPNKSPRPLSSVGCTTYPAYKNWRIHKYK